MAFVEPRVQDLQAKRSALGVALRLSVALAAGAFFLGLLFTWAAPERVFEAFGAVRPAWLGLGLAGVAAACGLRARRWTLMLRAAGAEVRFRDAAVPVMGAAALNNLLPLGAGEAIRLIALLSFAERPSARQLGTLAQEKRLDAAAALALLVASLGAWPQAPAAARLAPVAVLVASLLAVIAWAAAAVRSRPQARSGRAFRGREGGRTGPAAVLRLFGLSLAAALGEAAVFFAAARALGLAEAAPAAALAAGLTGLARLLPAPPAQIGLFDYLAAAAVAAFGAPPAEAVAFALLGHALFWGPVTAAGWWLLLVAARIGVARGPLVAASPMTIGGVT